MAANKTVVVLAPNGRRQNVSVTPNTTILQILEEVCHKHGYNVDDYGIKHFNRILDPNAILRFTGLPNNAQLEIVPSTKARTVSNVIICIQLENGERVTSEFTSNTSLAEVLRHLHLDEDLEKTVLIYMHREIYGTDVLEKTTLKLLGLNGGRAILRLMHRDPQQLKTQAHIDVPLKPKLAKVDDSTLAHINSNNCDKLSSEFDSNEMLNPSTSLKEEVAVSNLAKSKETEIKEEVKKDADVEDSNVHSEKKNEASQLSKKDFTSEKQTSTNSYQASETNDQHMIEFIGDRHALIYNQAEAQALPRDELPDNFYDLTVEDAKMLLRDAKRRREELEDAPFLTKSDRQANKEKRILDQLQKYQQTIIRIQFPDQFIIQGLFGPLESVQTIKDFVRNYLVDPNSEFEIYTAPPKHVLNTNARLIDEGLVPSAIVHYSGLSLLRPDIKQKSVDPKDAELQAIKLRMATKRGSNEVTNENTETVNTVSNTLISDARSSNSSSKNQNKIPKWFKKPFK